MQLVIEPQWSLPPAKLLNPGEAHLWVVHLEEACATADMLWELLSRQERGRARRFYHVQDRSGYVVSHAILRVLLGRYLDVAPEAVGIAVTADNKPYLPPLPGRPHLSFNLSHSGARAVIGITTGREIGVDIEVVPPDFPLADAARQVLTACEREYLAALPKERRIPEFFRIWTMKEAYLKGVGTGINRELNRLEVCALPGMNGGGCASNSPPEVEGWTLLELPPTAGYASAVALGRPPCVVRVFQVTPDAPFLCHLHESPDCLSSRTTLW